MNEFLSLFFKGVLMGVANIIPGVSGGTIAVVLHIFDRLIGVLNHFFSDFKNNIKFLAPLCLGLLTGILAFSKLIDFCFTGYPMQTNYFFVGLVVGSIPLIRKNAVSKGYDLKCIFSTVIAFVLVIGISLLKTEETSASDFEISFGFLSKVFLGSLVASSAMVIPGISGSFVMVLIGLYNVVIKSINGLMSVAVHSLKLLSGGDFGGAFSAVVSDKSFITVIFIGLGVICGIIIISKVIAFLLEKFFSITYFAILGLICASLVCIITDPDVYSAGITAVKITASAVTFVFGLLISLKLGDEK
jgi:putative membrane protein